MIFVKINATADIATAIKITMNRSPLSANIKSPLKSRAVSRIPDIKITDAGTLYSFRIGFFDVSFISGK